MTDAERLEAFANAVHCKAHTIMARCMVRTPASYQAIMELAAELCTEAANLMQQRQRNREAASIESLSLMHY